MVTHLMITLFTLLGVVSVVWSTGSPCHVQGCRNITIYLGPRWGSKVIYYNSSQDFRHVEVNNASFPGDLINDTNSISNDTPKQVDLLAESVENRKVPLLKQRPTPEDNSLPKGDTDVDPDRQIPFIFDLIVIDLISQNLTGKMLKDKLIHMDSGKLKNIRHLYVNNNNISFLPVLTFPVELEYGLVELSLDNNPLRYLSSYTRFELSRLGNLQILSLADTGLYYLDSLYLPSLNTLILKNNYLSSVPSAVESMPNLRHLDLSGNRIFSLNYVNLGSLLELRFLSLANNGMTFLWRDAFQSLYNLEKVYLNDNKLTHAIQVHVPVDADVYLGGNPWVCDCPLLNLAAEWSPRVADVEDVTCVDGDNQTAHPVLSLDRYNIRFACTGEHSAWRILEESWSTVRLCLWSYGFKLFTVSILLVCAILLTVRVLRAVHRSPPSEVPYAVLDKNAP